jgi:hypothetical protein
VTLSCHEAPLYTGYGVGHDLGLFASDDRVVAAVPNVHGWRDGIQAEAPRQGFQAHVVHESASVGLAPESGGCRMVTSSV